MDLPSLRQRCRERLRGLPVPRPFDVRTLCERVADGRGRPIHLMAVAMPAAGPCGLWISGERQDHIVYERSTSPMHQEHIIVHELAHLVLGHEGGAGLSSEHLGRLFPRLDPAMVRRALGRAAYSTDEEREAEMLASLLLEQADRCPPRRARATDPGSAAIAARLESSLHADA
jgi:hypothetical protein